jgi:hypothetical protein
VVYYYQIQSGEVAMERVDYESLIIQDLLNMHKSDELNLSPWYQRRSVWTRPQKAYLINTLFERKPIPSVYIRHHLDMESEKSIKEVVDGQQRLRAIIEYAADQYPARHPEHKSPKNFRSLTPTERSKFLTTKIAVGYLINADDSDVIEIFGRLNSISKSLNPQEKRNAKFSGDFKQFCLKQASQRVNFWREHNIFSANDIARMVEVQFVSDLVYNIINDLSDFRPASLDKIYKDYEEEFALEEEMERRLEDVFSIIASMSPGAIKDTIFSRPPLFFSLFLILDSVRCGISASQLESSLKIIDERYNVDTPVHERARADADFVQAVSSSTQRIKSRKARDAYIRKYLKV